MSHILFARATGQAQMQGKLKEAIISYVCPYKITVMLLSNM